MPQPYRRSRQQPYRQPYQQPYQQSYEQPCRQAYQHLQQPAREDSCNYLKGFFNGMC
jgi:hypothetical protein